MQIVHENSKVALIEEGDKQIMIHFAMFHGTETWKNETFYVKRFFSDGVEKFDIAESDDDL